MNKFTPGPWFLVEDIREESDEFTYIAGYDIKSNGAEIIGCEGISGGSAENLANARLIAAAPCLLEALEACRNELASMIDMHNAQDPDDGSWLYDHQTVCEADAAIARARGEA